MFIATRNQIDKKEFEEAMLIIFLLKSIQNIYKKKEK